jgi:dipeptidyl aminopeptidase/acylaminoacyl peptidase
MAGQVSCGSQSLAALGLAFASSAMPVAAAESVSLEVLFGKPALGKVALSPSGRYLAITVPGKNALLELRVANLDVKRERQALARRELLGSRTAAVRRVRARQRAADAGGQRVPGHPRRADRGAQHGTHPAGSPPGPLPAVVYVHGGPWARTNLEWSELSVPQFLASRGYVVIEPDFRGSTGYGVKHWRAGRGQWGLAMQDDLSDVLHWAIEKSLVDKGRVCIMGASYGGYAALMGPVRDPTAYRCVISWVAVTDLPQRLRDVAQTHVLFDGLSTRFLRREIGDPEKDAEKLQRTSPVFRAADIKVPVLAAWGKDDQRVPVEHGRCFRDAAAKAGVELEYVEYADEGHSWLRPATWIDFMGRAEKLLARTLGPAR